MKTISEGMAEILVPDVSLPELGRSAGFYNPAMAENRNISIAFLSSGIKNVLDSMTAAGIRAIRYNKELGLEVTACDVNEKAIELARKNIEKNKAEVELICGDCNAVMKERSFDAVDIDPYGSPAMFLDSAAHSANKMILVTATDTAALSGVYPAVAKRRYGILSKKCDYEKELGTRILLSSIILSCARQGKIFTPMISWQRRHYVRIIGRVEKNRTNEKFENLGNLYMGKLHDKESCKKALKYLENNGLKGRALVKRALEETETLFYYDLHILAKKYRKNIPKIDEFIERLKVSGFSASRTVFSDIAVKTDAEIKEIVELM